MERLTERERNVDGTGVAKEEITDGLLKPFADKILTKLAAYEDLEEQGLLVRLPCKVGDTVYVPTRVLVSEFKITAIFCDIHGTYFYWLFYCGIYERTSGFSERDIGKTVFLTREEAEKKLEEMKAND